MSEQNHSVDIPAWAMKIFIEAAERSYRRGFQHGLLQGESGTRHDDPKISKWRSAAFKLSDKNGTPYDPSELSIEERHTGGDGPRGHLLRKSRLMWTLWDDR